MRDPNALLLFAAVVRHDGFASAARAPRVPKSCCRLNSRALIILGVTSQVAQAIAPLPTAPVTISTLSRPSPSISASILSPTLR
jgi:hypothetical protein